MGIPSSDDPVEYVLGRLAEDGMVVDRGLVDLVIGHYRDFRFGLVSRGFGVRERGLYDVHPVMRRYYDVGRGEVRTTLRVSMDMDRGLRRALMEGFLDDPKVRGRVSRDCGERDLECIREALGRIP